MVSLENKNDKIELNKNVNEMVEIVKYDDLKTKIDLDDI